MPVVFQNIFRFILLVLVQVLVLNNIQFIGFINPYIYVLFILSLPYRTPRWFQLLLAFATGLIIDAFSNTPGMHTASIVFIAFLRNPVIRIFTSIDEGNNPTPSFHTFGVSAYIKYVVTLVLFHHTILFLLESFSFVNIWLTFIKIILSSATTLFIIFGIQSLKKT